MTQTVFLELVEAASSVGYQLQKANQSDEEYIKGLAFAIASVEQSTFDSMSRDAQRWYQDMSQKIKQPFDQWPKLPGFKDVAYSPPVRLATKRMGAVREIRKIIMMDYQLGARQVQKLIDATSYPGIKFETVSVIVSETKSFIMLAKELGFWRDKSIYEGEEKLTVDQASTQFPQ